MTRTPTTDEWGIDATWLDALDEKHEVAPATIERLREVIGTPPPDLEERAPIVARPGDSLEVDEAEVVCEDGEVRHIDGELPADFPLGYHWLTSPEGRRRRLIVSPGRATMGARSSRSAGGRPITSRSRSIVGCAIRCSSSRASSQVASMPHSSVVGVGVTG